MWNVRVSAAARSSRTLAALRASGHATVRGRGEGQSESAPERRHREGSGSLAPGSTRPAGAREGEEEGRTSVVQGLARLLVPQEGRLALGRDADALELVDLVALLLELLDALVDAAVDLAAVGRRVVLVPAGFGVNCESERPRGRACGAVGGGEGVGEEGGKGEETSQLVRAKS